MYNLQNIIILIKNGMGCYENPRGLARALTFVFNNAWEGGGGQ